MTSQNRVLRNILAIGILLLIVAVLTVGSHLKERDDEIDDAKVEASNLASVIAAQIGDASLLIDQSMQEIIEHNIDRSSTDSFASEVRSEETYRSLVLKLRGLSLADAIGIVDAHGELVSSTKGFPAGPGNVSDRAYFANLRRGAYSDASASRDPKSTQSASNAITFARRIETKDGVFLGAIQISVRPDHLVRSIASLADRRRHAFALLSSTGRVLYREPGNEIARDAVIPADSPWRQIVTSGGGVYTSPGYFDGKPQYVAVRPVSGLPLVMDVSVPEEVALFKWRRRTTAMGIGFAAIFALIVWSLHQLRLQYLAMLEGKARLRQREQEIKSLDGRLKLALSNMSQGLALFDSDRRLIVANERFYELCRDEQIKSTFPLITVDDVNSALCRHCVRHASDGACEVAEHSRDPRNCTELTKDGRTIEIESRALPGDQGWICTYEDVTERVEAAARNEFLALHDIATGIPNRARFQLELASMMQSERDDHLALVLIDVDRFKDVNDTFGHSIGDCVLNHVAKRLQVCAPDSFAARLGGDEFALLRFVSSKHVVDRTVRELMEAMSSPFECAGREVAISISAGIVFWEPKTGSPEDLLRRADLAMYSAKKDGRNCYRVFEEWMEAAFHEQATLAADLRRAIDRGELEVHYQPIINSTTNMVASMEALLRWRHPTKGMISPAIFVPIAEEFRLIERLGDFVLRQACADAAEWPGNVKVSVNASPRQIAAGGFVAAVEKALAGSGLSAGRLEIEITETVLLQEDARNVETLHAIKALGASIALDDFGTGYSSLSYLRMFPFDKVKIDRSFVENIVSDPRSAAIIAATTMLARSFEIETTAEGVETFEQYCALRVAGVTSMQGYYFSRPQPADHWRTGRGEPILLPATTTITRELAAVPQN